ncbi:putative oxidoreductase [Paraphoma chrysanthemicola]|uniref:Oxidoreductase n=1 Tax=Paraphoma chrysanthemicola TaxID=798071 RepID=A0A8K0RGR5_9PLEO|nr:putative oxidoreductase [Paraphoma chrysanthemicola]
MAPSALPVRACLIGLSSTAVTSWASAAHLPALLSPVGRSKITVTALLNSSVEAARSAIKTYNLSPDTKAFGSPEDVANDSEIDLVICNTRVDKHFETIIPSVRAGKDVYVEWPIASKQKHIAELITTARSTGSRIAVGLQGRWAPPVLKLQELLQGGSGPLGKVLSADVRAYGGTIDREILPTGLAYFADKEVGGNPIVIGLGHVLDFVLAVVGEFDPSTVHHKAQIQRPDIRVRDPVTQEFVGRIKSDVPDLLSLHGTLAASPLAAPSATLSVSFRRGQPFPGTPSLTWSINCEYGEIRLVSPSGISLQAAAYDEPVSIDVHHFDNDTIESVVWDWTEYQKELPVRARAVSHCLYAFADSRGEGDGWAGLESAAVRSRLIESFLNTVDSAKK